MAISVESRLFFQAQQVEDCLQEPNTKKILDDKKVGTRRILFYKHIYLSVFCPDTLLCLNVIRYCLII